jgi:hypothetical protein
MRWLRTLAAAAMVLIVGIPAARAQNAAKPPSAAQIKQELDKIKKGRTLTLFPAEGSAESSGATSLVVENTSGFNLVVLVVGPTTERVELGPFRMETLSVAPGDYEVAVTAVGRDIPPFYGKQKITASMLFRHKLSIPGV